MTTSFYAARAFAKALEGMTLTPVRKIQFHYDPFYENVNSLRQFLFHVSRPKSIETNPKCAIQYNIKNDRSEPVINVEFNNGSQVLFKTENMTQIEITKKFNEICRRHADVEVKPEKGRR